MRTNLGENKVRRDIPQFCEGFESGSQRSQCKSKYPESQASCPGSGTGAQGSRGSTPSWVDSSLPCRCHYRQVRAKTLVPLCFPLFPPTTSPTSSSSNCLPLDIITGGEPSGLPEPTGTITVWKPWDWRLISWLTEGKIGLETGPLNPNAEAPCLGPQGAQVSQCEHGQRGEVPPSQAMYCALQYGSHS